MIKDHAMLIAAGTGMAMHAFVLSRQHVTQLTALDASVSAGYVWKKVFLRGKKGM